MKKALTISRSTSRYKLLIFDWDGTLVNSLNHIIKCIRNVAVNFDLKEPTIEAIRIAIGFPPLNFITRVFPEADDHEKLLACFRHHYMQAEEKDRFFCNVSETLHTLYRNGFCLAIATNRGRSGFQLLLDSYEIKDLFTTVKCGDDKFTKPQPEVIWEILAETNVTRENALMIGDSEHDMQSARNACVDAVAVGYGLCKKKQLMQYAPIACISNIKDLLQLVAK